mmetsp:Transcript_37511/g.120944  ORF Transcript_37511/g.120944 Transcript_37511/m.120944 type:complete len:222 (+) Transcript_37511:982-1647(+)
MYLRAANETRNESTPLSTHPLHRPRASPASVIHRGRIPGGQPLGARGTGAEPTPAGRCRARRLRAAGVSRVSRGGAPSRTSHAVTSSRRPRARPPGPSRQSLPCRPAARSRGRPPSWRGSRLPTPRRSLRRRVAWPAGRGRRQARVPRRGSGRERARRRCCRRRRACRPTRLRRARLRPALRRLRGAFGLGPPHRCQQTRPASPPPWCSRCSPARTRRQRD